MDNKFIPIYELRGLKLIGWRNLQHALDYLFTDKCIKNGILIAVNAEKMLMLENDANIRNVVKEAEFKYADGISIVRSLRKKYPKSCISRIAGIDLWEAIMERAGVSGVPVFLIGGRPDVLAITERKLRTEWRVNIIGSENGYFKPKEQQSLFMRIRDSGAKIISVAMGSPRQEIFMHNCCMVYSDALYIGIGGAYDVFAGKIRRAPKLWQNIGLEWFYRLLLQPRRISRQLRLLRYFFWHYTSRL